MSSFKSNTSDLASHFSGLTANVPVGFYRYVLKGPPVARTPAPDWIPTLGGQVEVFLPEKFVVLIATADLRGGFSIDRAMPVSFVINGKIDPIPTEPGINEPVRIHLHALNPWSDVDVRVDPNGEFRIYQPLSGRWTLSVIRGEDVLHVQSMFFLQGYRSTSFVLKTSEKPESPLVVH